MSYLCKSENSHAKIRSFSGSSLFWRRIVSKFSMTLLRFANVPFSMISVSQCSVSGKALYCGGLWFRYYWCVGINQFSAKKGNRRFWNFSKHILISYL